MRCVDTNDLNSAYQRIYGPNIWVLDFAPWVVFDLHFKMDSSTTLRQTWNPNRFAFANELPESVAKPDFPVVFGEWHVASRRLREFLEPEVGGDVEFLPFRTRTSCGGDATNEYSVIHCMNWVDAVDRQRSVLMPGESRFRRSKQTGGNYLLESVVLQRSKLSGPMCRVLGWSEYHLYREDLVNKLQEEGFTGLKFSEVEIH